MTVSLKELVLIGLCACGAAMATTAAGCGGSEEPGGGGDDDGDGNGDGGGVDASTGTPQNCETLTEATVGAHITANVSWPATTGVNAGTGVVHIWTLSDLSFDDDGNATGTVRPCGSVIPVLEAADLVGGGMILTEIPDSVWDQPDIPVVGVTGTISGQDVGDTISMNPVASVVGVTMDDPMNGAWPQTGNELTGVDHDGSGQPGITSIPRGDAPYRLPPLDLIGALLPDGARGDTLYLGTRIVMEIEGTRDTCTSAKGAAIVHKFDNHIIGCHVKDGGECTPDQANFVDSNRTVFAVSDASYEMKQIAAGATCADVRAALPQ